MATRCCPVICWAPADGEQRDGDFDVGEDLGQLLADFVLGFLDRQADDLDAAVGAGRG